MRSWKTPALLATVGLCGLGSLFAQDPQLPSMSEPTPLNSPTLPMSDNSIPNPFDQNSVAPAPDYEPGPLPLMEQSLHPGSPTYGETPAYDQSVHMQSAPAASCDGCAAPAPVSACCDSTPACCSEQIAQSMPTPVMVAAPVFSQPSCGCQGRGSSYGGSVAGSLNGSYGVGDTPSHRMGGYGSLSGSGVSSGLISPNANSGGLHTRYPYYNYRHPWHYQGPPSQNVTIVW